MPSSSYHVTAVLLPDGADPIDLWVTDGKVTYEPVPDAERLDGAFVAPGLVDAHVHLSLDFAETGMDHGSKDLVGENLQRHVGAGVLALRDAGYAQTLRIDDIALPASPVVKRSGWILTPEGRFFPLERTRGIVVAKHTTPAELPARVKEVVASGIEWCKIIADFPGPDGNLFAAPPTYAAEDIREAVRIAHAHGVRVMAHTTGPTVADVVAAGVDSIEHGMSVTPDVVRAMAEQGTSWAPTLAAVEAYLKLGESMGASSAPRLAWSERMTASIRTGVELGVPVLVGSDEVPHGQYHVEADALLRHGMTSAQVIAAATTVGRAVLRLPGLDEGAPADLVLFDRDPRERLEELARPRAVIAAGSLVSAGSHA